MITHDGLKCPECDQPLVLFKSYECHGCGWHDADEWLLPDEFAMRNLLTAIGLQALHQMYKQNCILLGNPPLDEAGFYTTPCIVPMMPQVVIQMMQVGVQVDHARIVQPHVAGPARIIH